MGAKRTIRRNGQRQWRRTQKKKESEMVDLESTSSEEGNERVKGDGDERAPRALFLSELSDLCYQCHARPCLGLYQSQNY